MSRINNCIIRLRDSISIWYFNKSTISVIHLKLRYATKHVVPEKSINLNLELSNKYKP